MIPEPCIRYLHDIKKIAKKHNVKICFRDSKRVKLSERILTSGFFDETKLVVATNNPLETWFPVFIHESCHLMQFLYDKKLWNFKPFDLDPCTVVDEWIGGKMFIQQELDSCVGACTALERDCENRTVNTIIKYQMPFDISDYIKRANAYLYFYDIVRIYAKWYKTPPYKSSKIIAAMPGDKILSKHRVNAKLESLFVAECLN